MPNPSHYSIRKIANVNLEVDFKVSVLGMVVDKKDDVLVLDDGTGKVQVFVDSVEVLDNIDVNKTVRIFGSTIPTDEGFELKADIVQNMSSLDINLYKKVNELYNRMGVSN